jgi:hypothetical protein
VSVRVHQQPGNAPGLTLIELLVAAVIFLTVLLAMGSVYLFARRGFEYATTETFLQRQGTLLTEVLTDHILRASALQVADCHASSATIPSGHSIMYRRSVAIAGGLSDLSDEFWCIYRHQAAGGAPSLWRCPIAALSAGQTCTQNPQDLLIGIPAPQPGLAVTVVPVKDQNGIDQPIFSLAPSNDPAQSILMHFALDLREITTGQTVIFGERRFGINIVTRN